MRYIRTDAYVDGTRANIRTDGNIRISANRIDENIKIAWIIKTDGNVGIEGNVGPDRIIGPDGNVRINRYIGTDENSRTDGNIDTDGIIWDNLSRLKIIYKNWWKFWDYREY